MRDRYNLPRFVDAQNPVFEEVWLDLSQGYKTGHWMWFIFPQLQGLGRSSTAWEFGISCLVEAEAYVVHPILGTRLRRCTRLVTSLQRSSAEAVFGHPDCLKFRSSMTLFAHATESNQVFLAALVKFSDGAFDALTLEKLRST